MNQNQSDKTQYFKDIDAHNTVDYVLRTTQQNQMQLNLMADTKANIMITVSSIVFSLVLSQMDKPDLRLPMLTLAAFSLTALVLAILAILPRFAYPKDADGNPDINSNQFNLLFFGHFATMSLPEFKEKLADHLSSDPQIYESIAQDIYSLGTFLANKKYRYVRWSYVVFLSGMVIAGIEIVATIAMGLI